MIPDLALEILSYILSFCGERTLRKCCMLSRSLYILAGSFLYAKLVVDKESLTSLLHTGTESALFSPLRLAKEITINMKHLGPKGLPQFVQILGSLPKLRLLKLVAPKPTDSEMSAINSIFPSQISSSFPFSWHICSSIGDFEDNEAPVLATGLSALNDLRIMERWQTHIQKTGIILRRHDRPILHTLRLECEAKPWSNLEALVDVTQLQRLSFWLGGASGFQYQNLPERLLTLCAYSLRTLSIFISNAETSSQNLGPINRPFPKLETLILWMNKPPFPIRSWVIASLATILPQPNFHRLCLHIGDHASIGKPLVDILKDDDEFEELFTFLGRQKTISEIEMCIYNCARATEGIPELDLESSIRDWLKKAGWTKSLRCIWYRTWPDMWPFWERDEYMLPCEVVSGSGPSRVYMRSFRCNDWYLQTFYGPT
ncbi:hypothetical protein DL96DRAFT_1817238 [Flagelloscypha sp. PMI_526]|nr:hypothetical protein DL96DRAFT_1817238 [Flagelloscypha sp. PMI_526]